MSTPSIFFNQSFDKKKLKTFIYWVLKTFGEKEALTIVEELKRMGFSNATKAGLSIGLHDLKTPSKKKFLISRAQRTMNNTDREFQGAELTATERSQRIVDTWHRTSEDLRKQVVDYFSMYDQLNSVYMMASSGARGNFSQVRQLIGMRGLMADPQGQIISFPIRSNLREGLTLTEYFISCSGARKGLVDTALRTADTGYLTRRLVDISHHIVVKKVTCYTSRGIALNTLRTSQKILLPLKDRLVGRVLGENIYGEDEKEHILDSPLHLPNLPISVDSSKESLYKRAQLHSMQYKALLAKASRCKTKFDITKLRGSSLLQEHQVEERTSLFQEGRVVQKGSGDISFVTPSRLESAQNTVLIAKKNQEISPDLAFKISLVKANTSSSFLTKKQRSPEKSMNTKTRSDSAELRYAKPLVLHQKPVNQEIRQDSMTPWVLVRSPLTCAYTHEVCQLCYGWSMAQGSLVSLGEAVGVIAGQSIGEPGTQLTMRTFHTGGVFSGDLLQEIRAPHSGKIVFPRALQGLLIRTSQGKIAFLIKVPGELFLENDEITTSTGVERLDSDKVIPRIKHKRTKIVLEPSTILFVRQGQKVQNNQILAELARTSEEGNQPIKSRQTLFSEMTGRIIQWKSLLCRSLGKDSKKICNCIVTTKSDKEKEKLAMQKQNFDTQGIFPRAQEKSYSSSYSLRLKYDSKDRSDVDHNLTFKKVALSKKQGFASLEPPKALQLGLLSVMATRVGASESLNTSTKEQGIVSNTVHIKEGAEINLCTQLLPLPHLNTIAEEGDLVDENYAKV